MKGKFITSQFFAAGMQEAIDAHLNAFGALLFAESLENKPVEMQEGGVTILVHDHHGKAWFVTASTREPQVIE